MNEQELELQVINPVMKLSQDILIITAGDYSDTADILKKIKNSIKKVESYFDEIESPLRSALKVSTARKMELLKPLTGAEKVIKFKMTTWDQEQELIRLAEQLRLQAEADKAARRERERLMKQAEKLKTPELKEERLAAAEMVIAPVIQVQAETPKIDGLSMRTNWTITVMDKQKFIQAAATDQNLAAFLLIDEPALKKLASATQGKLTYPGISFWQEKVMAVRS
jgi:hypothetical protein